MKTVIFNHTYNGGVADQDGNKLAQSSVKLPEKGKEYRVTGEYRANGLLYYFLMGFGIKTVFKADLFQDA